MDLARLSAISFPRIPEWLGAQRKNDDEVSLIMREEDIIIFAVDLYSTGVSKKEILKVTTFSVVSTKSKVVVILY